MSIKAWLLNEVEALRGLKLNLNHLFCFIKRDFLSADYADKR